MTVRRPPHSITGGLKLSVEAELHQLLARAKRGELLGFAWVALNERGETEGGLAGNLGRDRHKAAGVLHQAASAANRADE